MLRDPCVRAYNVRHNRAESASGLTRKRVAHYATGRGSINERRGTFDGIQRKKRIQPRPIPWDFEPAEESTGASVPFRVMFINLFESLLGTRGILIMIYIAEGGDEALRGCWSFRVAFFLTYLAAIVKAEINANVVELMRRRDFSEPAVSRPICFEIWFIRRLDRRLHGSQLLLPVTGTVPVSCPLPSRNPRFYIKYFEYIDSLRRNFLLFTDHRWEGKSIALVLT